MMENPFVFGRVASGNSFTNRKAELKHLSENFTSGINTILISPRRWGKSSLVLEASCKVESDKTVFCFLDLFNIRSEEEFYEVLARQVIQASASRWEDWVRLAKQHIRQLIPHITLGNDPQSDFRIGFDWRTSQKDPSDILNLAEEIAKERKIKMVICIDEFQNIAYYADSLAFQKRLRSIWQYHQNTSYCIYGSKQHMMTDVFENNSMPFYKFGEVLFLNKIPEDEWVSYIGMQFHSTGKSISEATSRYIASMMDLHPYFVQQLASNCWRSTEGHCDDALVNESVDQLLIHHQILFLREIDHLSNTQINFLKALCSGVEVFSSLQTLNEYKLGSPSNITRIKQALVQKEILASNGTELGFTDPLFRIWFIKKYMGR